MSVQGHRKRYLSVTDPPVFSAQSMFLLFRWRFCARVKPRGNGLSVMLKSGAVKSLDLWNQIGVGAAFHTLSTITEDHNVAFKLGVNKVNPDGPSLKFSAGFSVSELPCQEVSGLDLIYTPENTSEPAQTLLNCYLSHPQLPLSRVRV